MLDKKFFSQKKIKFKKIMENIMFLEKKEIYYFSV
jgi:hypothetical protein